MTYPTLPLRFDIKCGKSGIANGKKCHTQTSQTSSGVTQGLDKVPTDVLMRHKDMLVNDLYVKYGGRDNVHQDFNKFHQWATKQQEYKELMAISQIVGKREQRGDSVWATGFNP
jgi:hypothetical protein